VELDERGWRCWQHFKEMRAVGFQVDDVRDALVREHAAIFREAEERASRKAAFEDLVTLGRIIRRDDHGGR
jgi:hypothetical protein